MTAPGPRTVVLGDVMTDVIARHHAPIAWRSDAPATIEHRSGGAGSNVAHWMAAGGADVTLVVSVGDDAEGRAAVQELASAGVDVQATVVPDLATGCIVVLVDSRGERTFLSDQGANARMAPPVLPADAGHLHVSGYAVHNAGNRDMVRDAIAEARAAGLTASVDPASVQPLHVTGPRTFLDVVRGVTMLVVTVDEAELLVGTRDPARATDALGEHAAEVVLKLGRAGAIYCGGGMEVHVPAAEPPGPVVDSTGAGDAFLAVLLTARARGEDPVAAVEAACRAGALAATRVGARPPVDGVTPSPRAGGAVAGPRPGVSRPLPGPRSPA